MTDRVYLGIDYGDKRIGLATADADGWLAAGYKTLVVRSSSDAVAKVVREIELVKPLAVIIGYPVADDGGAGERCRRVDGFIEALNKQVKVTVNRVDERDTTTEAMAIAGTGKKGRDWSRKAKKSGKIDLLAAIMILQRWLNEHQRDTPN